MLNVGIMQGRVLPETLSRLQVFPSSQWETEIQLIQSLGFGCVELLYDRAGECPRVMAGEHAARKLALTGEQGEFSARSMCMDYLTQISILDTSTQQQFMKVVESTLSMFCEGTSLEVLVLPLLDHGAVESSQDLVEVLTLIRDAEFYGQSRQCGVQLALELNMSAVEIRSAFSAVPLKGVGICYDLGNARASGWIPQEEIDILRELIVHVHIKDRPVGGGNVMLGVGDVDFPACLRALNAIGYQGQMVFETIYHTHPRAEAQQNLEYFLTCLPGVSC